MNDNVMKILVGVVACAIFTVLCFGVIQAYNGSEFYARESAKVEVQSGEITNKQIVNASKSIFSSQEMDYQISILYTFEHNGETKTATKWISVERDIYTEAEVGMWFDGNTLTLSNTAETNNPV